MVEHRGWRCLPNLFRRSLESCWPQCLFIFPKPAKLFFAPTTALPPVEIELFLKNLKINPQLNAIRDAILPEVFERLNFMSNVGLEYLSLNRETASLSGGESQRIRLAGQLGSNLSGVLYVLDEPSIGLHPSDNQKLIDSLRSLQKREIPCSLLNTTKRLSCKQIA